MESRHLEIGGGLSVPNEEFSNKLTSAARFHGFINMATRFTQKVRYFPNLSMKPQLREWEWRSCAGAGEGCVDLVYIARW